MPDLRQWAVYPIRLIGAAISFSFTYQAITMVFTTQGTWILIGAAVLLSLVQFYATSIPDKKWWDWCVCVGLCGLSIAASVICVSQMFDESEAEKQAIAQEKASKIWRESEVYRREEAAYRRDLELLTRLENAAAERMEGRYRTQGKQDFADLEPLRQEVRQRSERLNDLEIRLEQPRQNLGKTSANIIAAYWLLLAFTISIELAAAYMWLPSRRFAEVGAEVAEPRQNLDKPRETKDRGKLIAVGMRKRIAEVAEVAEPRQQPRQQPRQRPPTSATTSATTSAKLGKPVSGAAPFAEVFAELSPEHLAIGDRIAAGEWGEKPSVRLVRGTTQMPEKKLRILFKLLSDLNIVTKGKNGWELQKKTGST